MNKTNNRKKTLEVIMNANKGIDLSKSFDNVDDLMAALNELDAAIDDVEGGRVTPHDESMRILKKKYDDYVSKSIAD